MAGIGGEPGDVEDGVVVGVDLLDAGLGRCPGRVEDPDFAIFVGNGEVRLGRSEGEPDDERRNRHSGLVA